MPVAHRLCLRGRGTGSFQEAHGYTEGPWSPCLSHRPVLPVTAPVADLYHAEFLACLGMEVTPVCVCSVGRWQWVAGQ